MAPRKAKTLPKDGRPKPAHLRVLFPLDGSEEGYAGLERTFQLLPPATIEATLLVVLQDFKGASEETIQQFEEDRDDEVFPNEDSALYVLRQATRRLRERGARLHFKMAKGNVKREILAEASQHDLLVMHRRPGRHRFGGATALARQAACSVLLVRL